MMDENKLLDQLVDRRYYPKDLIEKMKESIKEEKSGTVREFKELMEGLAGSGLLRKAELQLTILEDIIMNFMNPYTRQLLLERISKKCEFREYLTRKKT